MATLPESVDYTVVATRNRRNRRNKRCDEHFFFVNSETYKPSSQRIATSQQKGFGRSGLAMARGFMACALLRSLWVTLAIGGDHGDRFDRHEHVAIKQLPIISLIATWRSKVIAMIATDHHRKDLDTRWLGEYGRRRRASGQGSRGRLGRASHGVGGVGPGCGFHARSRIGEAAAYPRATRMIYIP